MSKGKPGDSLEADDPQVPRATGVAGAATAALPGPRFLDWDELEPMAVALSFLRVVFFG